MEVKLGYRQTEVGEIPIEWETPTLGSLTLLMTNGFVGPATRHYAENDNGVLYIQGYNVEENSFNFHGIKYVKEEFHRAHMKSCLRGGDLLTVQTGEVGLTTIVPDSLAGSNCHALIISRFDQKRVSPTFISYYLNSKPGRSRLRLIETGTTMKHLNVGDVLHFSIPLPPTLAEQRAIAEALSDADALIESLEQLIAKKRLIKQGAMQELLTGKRRLPGFEGKWVVKRLGEETSLITKGTTPTSLGKEFTDQGINFVKVESFTEGGAVIPEMLAAIDEDTHCLLQRSQLQENDILFSIAGALGRVAIVTADLLPANTNQALSIIRLKTTSRLGHKFLLMYLRSSQISAHINAINVQAAQANLSLEDVRNFEVPVPSTDEQTAIAAILSDMDAEIAALEERLAKSRQLKQGMMQELLTGRVRLV